MPSLSVLRWRSRIRVCLHHRYCQRAMPQRHLCRQPSLTLPLLPMVDFVKGDAVFGPSGRIILQDLNVALSSNFKEMPKHRPMSKFVQEVEEYRSWIVDLLKHEYVILVTARSVIYEDMTLERIKSLTDWQPNQSCFNPWEDPSGKGALRAHRAKARYLKEVIMPVYGDDPSTYFAIESNKFTRAMYRANDIECRDANRDDSQPWKTLLP